MYQYFAKEKHPRAEMTFYNGSDHATIIDKDIWTAFSGRWHTRQKAELWYHAHGGFFEGRGIELMLFVRINGECYMPYNKSLETEVA